tara:strand:+ start:694 stop:3099 length:2406 start_codon:yes stop_codon:yes gene_type:complete
MSKSNEYLEGTGILDSEAIRLRNYQLEGVKEILEKRRAILADDMGLGKTGTALTVRKILESRGENYKTLVVCPGSTISHWYRESELWCPGDKTSIIQTSTYDDDLERARDSNICIIPYSTLSTLGKDNSERLDQLRELGFNYGILDEAHNAKNPASIRSSSIRNLFHDTNYLSLLTGTPIPNSIVDICSLLNLVDSEAFPITSENPKDLLRDFKQRFRDDPTFVKNIISEHLIKRNAENYIHETLPKLEERKIEVPLEGAHKEIYEAIREQDLESLTKMNYLSRVSINPQTIFEEDMNGAFENFPRNVESNTFQALDDIVDNSVKNGGKVLIFSNLKRGVHKELRERYSQYGALVVNGDCSTDSRNGELSEREKIRQQFQNDSNYQVLIAGDVMSEGVDLTAATDVVHLNLPWTPAELKQRVRRSQRISAEVDKESVNVYTIIPTLGKMDSSITEGIEKLIEEKDRVLTGILENPHELDVRHLDEILSNESSLSSSSLTYVMHTPNQAIAKVFGGWKAKGGNLIKKRIETNPAEAEQLAKLYASHWEGFYQGNVGNLQGQIINLLESNEDLEDKLDIASGPFSLSRVLQEPLTNIDLNNYMLQAGRELENQGIVVPGNEAINCSFSNLPFDNDSFSLANLSLALHYTRLNRNPDSEKINEREGVLREMHRVLRYGGIGLISSPVKKMISSSDQERFNFGLEKLGFEVLPFSGIYGSPTDNRFRTYLTGIRKVGDAPKSSIGQEHLTWEMDREKEKKKRKKSVKRNKNGKKKSAPKTPKPKVINDFEKVGTRKTPENLIEEM